MSKVLVTGLEGPSRGRAGISRVDKARARPSLLLHVAQLPVHVIEALSEYGEATQE